MANQSTVSGLSREVIASVLRDAKNEARLQEAERLRLAVSESVFVTLVPLPARAMDWRTPLSTQPKVNYPAATVPAGTFFRIYLGDRIPDGPSFRRATREELASGITTVEDAAGFLEAGRPVRSAEALVQAVTNEVQRAHLKIEEAQRQAVDLDAALSIAKGREEDARINFEKFFEGRTTEFRAAVADLARRLETPPPPPQAEPELPHTVEEIRRREQPDTLHRAFKMGPGGPEPLTITGREQV